MALTVTVPTRSRGAWSCGAQVIAVATVNTSLARQQMLADWQAVLSPAWPGRGVAFPGARAVVPNGHDCGAAQVGRACRGPPRSRAHQKVTQQSEHGAAARPYLPRRRSRLWVCTTHCRQNWARHQYTCAVAGLQRDPRSVSFHVGGGRQAQKPQQIPNVRVVHSPHCAPLQMMADHAMVTHEAIIMRQHRVQLC